MTDKLKEALRRAEEAVLKDGKLRDEEVKKEKEKEREKKTRKPIDLDNVLFDESRAEKQKQVEMPKQDSGPRMVDLGQKKRPKPKKPADQPPPNLSFGELNLKGASTDSPELELAATQKEPAAKPAAPAPPAAPAVKPPEAKPAKREPAPRREPAEEYVPRRSYGRQIKIFLIVVLILGAIGGGVWGFLKWRESVEAAEAAEKAKIESSSRDSLMDDKFKKEKFK